MFAFGDGPGQGDFFEAFAFLTEAQFFFEFRYLLLLAPQGGLPGFEGVLDAFGFSGTLICNALSVVEILLLLFLNLLVEILLDFFQILV